MSKITNPPLCKNCEYYGVNSERLRNYAAASYFVTIPIKLKNDCNHPSLPKNHIDGGVFRVNAYTMRGEKGACGEDGVLFIQEKEPDKIKEKLKRRFWQW